ncbi:unnamed protein product [Allacma fusca]|uniref:Uncharacterized protein n=1 Tax=Allacma fusca TaxID=39272 RepID=A0A8J2J5F8_9HEXA|nr:unnamed protein product [Allacma fusca]
MKAQVVLAQLALFSISITHAWFAPYDAYGPFGPYGPLNPYGPPALYGPADLYGPYAMGPLILPPPMYVFKRDHDGVTSFTVENDPSGDNIQP